MLVRDMGINNLTVECDSQIVVHAMQQGPVRHWRLHYVLRSCLSAFHASFSIHHIYCSPIWWLIYLQLGCNDIVRGVIFSD